jgi:orotidine-5'-phosphate decarboxylase
MPGNARHFGDRLHETVMRDGPLCVGLDPHPGTIPACFGGGESAIELKRWGHCVLEALSGICAIIKPQVGLFEMHGPEGMEALAHLISRARDMGFIVIADAKRGDIGSTAEGYARAWLEPGAPFEADCLTVNPYMGRDTLTPFLDRAASHGKGVAVLARTSNPGAADFQMMESRGRPLVARLVEALQEEAHRLQGAHGWSSLVLVVGATVPGEAADIREISPATPFLVPGYGAQGGGAHDAVAGFAVDGSGRKSGGVVNSSRGITATGEALAAPDWDRFRAAISAAARAAQDDLRQAAGYGQSGI